MTDAKSVKVIRKQLMKPRISRKPHPWPRTPWHLEVPDQGSAYATIEPYETFEDALAGLADWWAHGNRAGFLRHPGYGRDRRGEAQHHIAEQQREVIEYGA